jgi:hypothetical protein
MNGIKYSGKSLADIANSVEAFATGSKNRFLLKLWNDLVDSTPVDTGAARSNWTITPLRPSAFMNARDGTQYPRPSEPDIAQHSKTWGTWFIVNNSPYITYLNDGSSKQAPAGWINAAIQRNLVIFKGVK